MPILKDRTIVSNSRDNLWDELVNDPSKERSSYIAGDRVQTRSGGRVLTVIAELGAEVQCRINERRFTLPVCILMPENGHSNEAALRRGRRVNRNLAP